MLTVISGLIAGLTLLVPQGGPAAPTFSARSGSGTMLQPVGLRYPLYADVDRFAPFNDASGQPVATTVGAAGTADLDGDGNRDLWFFSEDQGGVSVQMARTSSLGRYRGWYEIPTGPWVDAARFRSPDRPEGDRVLLIDPGATTITALTYHRPPRQPQAGGFVATPFSTVGNLAYEIATRDDDGDGLDDIALLQAAGFGWTKISKLCMAPGDGGTAARTPSITLTAIAQRLEMLDVDGDGVSEVLVVAQGTVLVLRDNGRRLVIAGGYALPGPTHDVFVGDADRDGRDDVGLVLDQGILMLLARPGGAQAVALMKPPGFGTPLAGRVIGDGAGMLTSVIAFEQGGRAFAIYPFLGQATFAQPTVYRAPLTTEFGGAGLLQKLSLIVDDLDGDGDQDVVTPLADGKHWLRLRADEIDLRPTSVTVTSIGPIGGPNSGFTQFKVVARFPQIALNMGLDEVEMAVFLEDINQTVPRHIYWGRLRERIDPTTRTVTFMLHSQLIRSNLKTLLQNGTVFPFPGGIAVGGDTVLFLHLQEPGQGPRRYESISIHHDDGGGGQRSATGIRWDVRDSPPRSDTDVDLLPWR